MADKASILKEAQKFLAKGQLDKAIAEWEKLLQMAPDANTHNTVGDLYLKKNDRPRAVEHFHKAAEIFRKEGFSLKALAIYKKVLNVNPHEARALYSLGELNQEKNIVTDAIKYYLAAGDSFLKANQKEDAVKTYQKILALAPNNLSLKLKISELFSKEGFVEETSNEYADIARLYAEEEHQEEAQKYLQKALEIKPNNRKALIALADHYEQTDEHAKALELLKTAIVRTGKTTELLLKVAALSLTLGRYSDARDFAGAVIQADSSNFEARQIMAETCLKEGNMEAAWREYGPIVDELIFKNRFDEAVGILNMFKEIEPVEARRKLISFYKQKSDNDAAFSELCELGGLYEETDMRHEAISCYKEALTIDPENAEVRLKIAELENIPEPDAPPAEEKSVEELLQEAEIFIGYGMLDEARGVLEGLKLRAPENITLHLKLKSVYLDSRDTEQAVTECIILSELYRRAHDDRGREAVIKEAFSLNPEDPRLVERFGPPKSAAPEVEELSVPSAAEEDLPPAESEEEPPVEGGVPDVPGPVVEEYDEELAEADFYVKQGLYDDAEKIYKKFRASFPGNAEFQARLEEIERLRRAEPALPVDDSLEDLQSLSIEEVIGGEEIEEPAMENDVLEIFEEFKKGLEKELEEEDTETHYNLGIAYKEMGITDDAIREFQKAQHDPKFFIQAATMLGMCYMEKRLYPLAVEALQSALMKVEKRSDAYWGLKYDLAAAFEKTNSVKQAYEIYMEIYGWDSGYRNVAEKISRVQAALKPQDKSASAEAVPGPESPAPGSAVSGDRGNEAGPEQKTKGKSRVSYI